MVRPSVKFRNFVTGLLFEATKDRKDVTIVYENQTIGSLDKDTKPKVLMEIEYLDSQKADLNENPMYKDVGYILVTVLVKEGEGSLLGFEIREDIIEALGEKTFEGAKLFVAAKARNLTEIKGWVGYRFKIPFWHMYTRK